MSLSINIISKLYIIVISMTGFLLTNDIFHTSDPRDVEEYDSVCQKDIYEEVVLGQPMRYYDVLSRITPTEVGKRRSMLIGPKKYIVVTRAIEPPIFEVLNYLSDEECDTLIKMALERGLFKSRTMDDIANPEKSEDALNISERARVSQQTWLDTNDYPDHQGILHVLKERLFYLTGLPWKIIQDSEAMQVARYTPGGHYHAHFDSTEFDDEKYTEEDFDNMDCCHHTYGNDTECRICRYMTVMYYLNEVQQGGETAFVTAKLHPHQPRREQFSENLSMNCSDANLLIKPKKGSAIFWYNHYIDPVTGWLGENDENSLHGGCDVIKGEKWIGNNWINVPPYESRYLNSIYNPMTPVDPPN